MTTASVRVFTVALIDSLSDPNLCHLLSVYRQHQKRKNKHDGDRCSSRQYIITTNFIIIAGLLFTIDLNTSAQITSVVVLWSWSSGASIPLLDGLGLDLSLAEMVWLTSLLVYHSIVKWLTVTICLFYY